MQRIASILYTLLACGGVIAGCISKAATSSEPARDPKTMLLHGITALDSAAARLELAVLSSSGAGTATPTVRRAFLETRLAYKRIELFSEYFAPGTSDMLNGPALDEVEEGDPNQTIVPPRGLQVIEEELFADSVVDRSAASAQIRELRSVVRQLRTYAAATTFVDANVFDAMRLELARVSTLGMAGFDAPVMLTSLPECAAALEGMVPVAAWYVARLSEEHRGDGDSLIASLARAAAELRGASFASYDRLGFITRHANPIARRLSALRTALGIPITNGDRLLRAGAVSVFDAGAFDAQAAAPPGSSRATADQVELGRLLFFDPVLSGNLQRSCASCHRPERGFAEAVSKSVAFDFSGSVERNAPTLINAGLQRGSFYDLRVLYLEDQATAVIGNPNEMHGSMTDVLGRIRSSAEYASLFGRAFRGDAPINDANVRRALAAFIRSLERLDSPFDRAARGDERVISDEARRGYTLFMGKARCGTCHFAPLFNGMVPPAFDKAEVEIIGVTERFDTLHPKLDRDLGRGPVVGIDILRNAFRTPTLRNVAVTAPYMHNGAFATLEEVVEFYDRGGGEGLGVAMHRQTLPPDRLDLSAQEKRELIAFMHALTDTSNIPTAPGRLPTLAGVERVVGGRY